MAYALFRGIEAINTELKMGGSQNRILEISPGSIKGTSFNGGETEIDKIKEMAAMIKHAMYDRKELLIPEFESIFKNVLDKYSKNPSLFAEESYQYKIKNNRLQLKPQIIVGYLSGTFDLFHIGHLNLLKRAKKTVII